MAKIIFENQEKEVEDGASIIPACEDLGVPFGCEEGLCGSCTVEVLDGAENLSERTENEENLGVYDKHRLACQCKIKQGNVKIKF